MRCSILHTRTLSGCPSVHRRDFNRLASPASLRTTYQQIQTGFSVNSRRSVGGFVCAAAPASSEGRVDESGIKYDNIMLAILDSNPYLSDASRTAISTAAGLSHIHHSKVTVLLVDQEKITGDPAVRLDTIGKALKEHGCEKFQIIERENSGTGASVSVGDVADEANADLLVVSSEAVHSKKVDANLLAEFVPCPLLLLP